MARNVQNKTSVDEDELPKWLRERYEQRAGPNAADDQTCDKAHVDQISDLERRLRALKDEPEADIASHDKEDNPKFLPPKRRTQAERADELIGELSHRVRLDTTYDPVAQIEQRLERLRGHTNKTRFDVIVDRADSTNSRGGQDGDVVDSDEEAEQIIKQLKGEADLEDKLLLEELESPSPPGSSDDEDHGNGNSTRKKNGEKRVNGSNIGTDGDDVGPVDELPFCCLCNEDATVRCRDCDNDLFCARCLHEVHDEWGYVDHRTTQYKIKPQQ